MHADRSRWSFAKLRRSALGTIAVRGIGGLAAIAFATVLVRTHSGQSAAIAAFFTGTAAFRLAAALASGGCENGVVAASAVVTSGESRARQVAIGVASVAATRRRLLTWSAGVAVAGGLAMAVAGVATSSHALWAASLGVALSPTLAYLRIVSRSAVATVSPAVGASAESLVPQLLLLAALLLPLPSDVLATGLLVLQAVFAGTVAAVLHLTLRSRSSDSSLTPEELARITGAIEESASDMLTINLLGAAMEQFDILVLGFLSSPIQVNAYALAKRVVGPLVLVAGGIATHYVPGLTRTHAHQGAAAGARAVRALRPRLLAAALAGAAAIAAAAMVLRPPGLTEVFLIATGALLLGQVANVAAGPVGLFLQTTGDAAPLRRVSLWLGVGYLGAIFVVAPVFGAAGAASVQAAGTVARNAWGMVRVSRRERHA